MSGEQVPDDLDLRQPNAARVYDYLLGGKDNFAVDRAMAEQMLALVPEMRVAARHGRALLGRMVHHLVAEAGVRQIVDLGSGLPTQDNVHGIAAELGGATRVAYVDSDPVVCAHARALLQEPGRVGVVEADLRRPHTVLEHPDLAGLIDLDRPVALLMTFVLHLIADSDHPHEIVAAYRDAVVPGSYLAISHACNDPRPETAARMSALYERATTPFVPRSRDEIAGFFGDFELLAPGLVELWPYPEVPEITRTALAGTLWSGIARKPGPSG